jgi:DNA-binding LytR/AlgR family response regulator
MLRIAVCDDMEVMRREVVRALKEYFMSRAMEFTYYEFANGPELLHSDKEFDLIFMDYQLEENTGRNGIAVAHRLREKSIDVPIIFLSSFPNVVFASFEVNAFRFLVKPINPVKFKKAMDDFLKTLENEEVIILRIEGVNQIINAREIIFLEGDGKYCIINVDTKQKEIHCHDTLSAIEEKLPQAGFFRSHRSFVVNMKYVSSYDNNEITLTNGATIYISRKKYSSFHKAYIEYSKRYGYSG